MSIARKLFCIWLVGSALWISAIGTLKWPWGREWPYPWEEIRPVLGNGFEVQTPDGTIHRFSADATSDEIDRAVTNYWRWHETKSTLRLALIAPALVLLIGAALKWAFEGFRPADHD